MDANGHLPYWTLEQLVDGALSHVERSLAEQHLSRCAHCAAELKEARALVASLEAFPALAPSPRFADAVMARVNIAPVAAAEPAAMPVRAGSRRWKTLVGMVLAPLAILAAWFGGSAVGMGGVWSAVSGWSRDVSWNLLSEGTETLIRTGMFQWGADTLASIPGPTLAGLPVILLVLAAAVPAAAWTMARMLRAPATGMTHA